jgi:nucleotide-binding universal stress UspA family protein
MISQNKLRKLWGGIKVSSDNCILACIDSSNLSQSVIDYAIWLAKSNQQPLMFVHTIEHSHLSSHPHHEGAMLPNMAAQLLDELSEEEAETSKRQLADGKALLKLALDKAHSAGLDNTQSKLRHGTLNEALTDLADDYDFVVLGATGVNHEAREGLGNHLEDAIRALHCPIFIVKKAFEIPNKMLFAYNASPTSKKALLSMNQQAFVDQVSQFHLVTVNSDEPQAQSILNDGLSLITQMNTPKTTAILGGDPNIALLAYQQEHQLDLIAMGAFGHGKLHGFFFWQLHDQYVA